MTGANRGLGLETSRQLLGRGLTVVLAGRDEAALERAHRSLSEQQQRRAMTIKMDVTDVESIIAAQQRVTDSLGSVDVLVNNAAVLLHETDDALSIPLRAYQSTFDTNVFGVVEVCRAFAPNMARA